MTKLLRGLKIGIWNLEFICDLEFGTWNFLAQAPTANGQCKQQQ